MSPKVAAPSLDDLRAQIRESGLRATAPRIAVLRGLLAAKSPLSHAELVEKLAAEGWDRATIYRNLTDLTEVGLARRTDLGDHVWRFEAKTETAEHSKSTHPHFLCDDCGNVMCLPDQSVQIVAARGAPRALRGKGLEIQVRGRCDRCG